MINSLYGTLHTPIKPPSYAGRDSDSIIVTVDNADRRISAELTEHYIDKINQIDTIKIK